VVSPRGSSDLEAFRWVNTVIANLKIAMRGTYHHFNFAKYRARYLAEAQYRLNRRFDLASIVELYSAPVCSRPPAPKLGCAAARSATTDACPRASLATDARKRPRRGDALSLKARLPARCVPSFAPIYRPPAPSA
jgi:hypothetical protein